MSIINPTELKITFPSLFSLTVPLSSNRTNYSGDRITGTYMPPRTRASKPSEEIVVQEITEGPIGSPEGVRKRRKSIHSPTKPAHKGVPNGNANGSPKVSKLHGSGGIGSRGILVVGK